MMSFIYSVDADLFLKKSYMKFHNNRFL